MTIAPVAASLPLVDPFIEPQAAQAEAPLAAPMAAPLAAPMAAAAPTPEQQQIIDNGQQITFTSLDQAKLVLGLDDAQAAELKSLTFMIWRDENNGVRLLPVTLKRQGTGSILNPAANATAIVPAGNVLLIPSLVMNGPAAVLPASPEHYGPTPPFTEDQFLAMHSSEQVAAMLLYGVHYKGRIIFEMPWNTQADPANPGQPRRADQDFIPNLTAILSDAGDRAILVDQLDNRAIAKLSKAEQESVALHVAFHRKYGPTLGLSATASTAVDDAILAIMGYAVPIPRTTMNHGLGSYYVSTDLAGFSEEDRAVFVKQLEILKEKLESQGIFNPKALEAEVTAIVDRFKTAYAYGKVQAQSVDPILIPVNLPHVARRYHAAISLDGGATIKSGFDNFMAQERRLLELAEARADVTKLSSGDRRLDLPALILKLQLYSHLSTDALVNIKTEEVRQQNDLLKTYAEMQRMVSERASAGGGNYSLSSVTNSQGSIQDWELRVILLGSMFHNDSRMMIFWEQHDYHMAAHPLEELKGITRPTMSLFTDASGDMGARGRLSEYNGGTWASYGTRLSDTVTLINQETQIQMNAISTLEKEKNRYFEMGNNALAKLNEIVQSIARSI